MVEFIIDGLLKKSFHYFIEFIYVDYMVQYKKVDCSEGKITCLSVSIRVSTPFFRSGVGKTSNR